AHSETHETGRGRDDSICLRPKPSLTERSPQALLARAGRHHKLAGQTVQPVIDTPLFLARKRRALARTVPGADFLMRRATEDLADRLSTVERRFAKAAVLFCQTPAAAEVLAGSGKVAEIIRVEADAAFLAGDGAIIAP